MSNSQVFQENVYDLGKVSHELCPIKIDIGSEPVPYHKPYPLSLEKRKGMKKVLEELLDLGIIEEAPNDAEGEKPAILVPKPDGSYRLVVDYRALNGLIKRRSWPMPLIDEYLDSLRGMQYFSLIDLAQGYYQIELHPDERRKTVFTTTEGKFQFTRLPMALAESSRYFQRLIEIIIRDLKYDSRLGYFDDIPSMGQTSDEFVSNTDRSHKQIQKF